MISLKDILSKSQQYLMADLGYMIENLQYITSVKLL